jgi:hypothetical protein
MGRAALQKAAIAGGAGLAPLTLREAYQHIVDTSAQSPMVIGLEPLLLEEPVLKLRVHVGTSLFIDVFYNAETGKTSFALIQEGQRIFGADNTRGWHRHPFESPERHCPCEATSFASFLQQVEDNQARWA